MITMNAIQWPKNLGSQIFYLGKIGQGAGAKLSI